MPDRPGLPPLDRREDRGPLEDEADPRARGRRRGRAAARGCRHRGSPGGAARFAQWFLDGTHRLLANIYQGGLGVPADPTRALAFMKQAWAEGDREGGLLLAGMLREGRVTSPDPDAGDEILAKLAAIGYAPAKVARAQARSAVTTR